MGLVMREGVKFLFKGKSVKTLYAVVGENAWRLLCERYRQIAVDGFARYEAMGRPHLHSDKVWFCWLQGISEAPALVKACLKAARREMTGREVVVVTEENYREYVALPEEIERRWRNGQIPNALFSDLLRLQLLIEHGGVWMDATVLCTRWDNNDTLRMNAERAMDSNLFLFQYVDNKSRTFLGVSNWFIAARSNNEALMVLRDMLFEYWKEHDCVLDYYMFHRFFALMVSMRPQIIGDMHKGYSVACLQLGQRLAEDFDGEWWNKLTSEMCFHKLNYRKEREAMRNERSYCRYILS